MECAVANELLFDTLTKLHAGGDAWDTSICNQIKTSSARHDPQSSMVNDSFGKRELLGSPRLLCNPIDLRLAAKPRHLALGIISMALLRRSDRPLK